MRHDPGLQALCTLWAQDAHWEEWWWVQEGMCLLPTPQFSQQRQLLAIGDNQRHSRSMTTSTWIGTPQPSHLDVALPNNDGDDKYKAGCEGVTYDKLNQTKDIAVENDYVTFTWLFRYLSSLISYNLRNNEDNTAQVAAATASMGALKEVCQNTHHNIYSKNLLFWVIPMNLVLWGCETWSLR